MLGWFKKQHDRKAGEKLSKAAQSARKMAKDVGKEMASDLGEVQAAFDGGRNRKPTDYTPISDPNPAPSYTNYGYDSGPSSSSSSSSCDSSSSSSSDGGGGGCGGSD